MVHSMVHSAQCLRLRRSDAPLSVHTVPASETLKRAQGSNFSHAKGIRQQAGKLPRPRGREDARTRRGGPAISCLPVLRCRSI